MAVSQKQRAARPWLDHYPQRVPPELDYPRIPLYQLLIDSATKHPDHTAVVFFDKKTTYGELLSETKRVAGGLAKLGIKKGDRVGIMLPNCPQLVATYYGVLWAGGTVVMVNPIYTPRELAVQLRDCGARFLIVLNQVYPTFAKAAGETSLEKIIVTGVEERLPFPLNWLYPLSLRRTGKLKPIPQNQSVMRYSELIASEPMEQPIPVEPEKDLAALQYTGGTTGTPKGVMLTHANLVANSVQLRAWVPPWPEGQLTILGALPFFHVYGMTTVMNYAIVTGARMVLFPRFELERVLKAIQRYRPQLFPGVPTMYVAINNNADVKRYDLKSIRWCLSGAAPLPLEVKQTFDRITGGNLTEGYGLSEASPVTHANPLDGVGKSGSIGLPLPDTECRIVGLNSDEPVLPGEPGELLIRGPQVMAGYWNHPEETAATIKDGWLRTGDVARMDAEGYFYIVDRKKEMIISGGFNVYPRELEEVLYQHPAIKEAAVIGIADKYRGESAKAFVVLKDGASCTAAEVTDWCRLRLAAYKIPREIEFVHELPKSLIGKVLRRVLVEKELSKQGPGASGQPAA